MTVDFYLTVLVHLVAHAWPGLQPLMEAAPVWHLWSSLRAAWPAALAVCLMPDHIHLIVEVGDPEATLRKLRSLLGGTTRRAGGFRVWQPAPAAEKIPDAHHLLRQLRYVALNPCRAGLAADPLSWPWSTHRGTLGAEVDAWVPPQRLAHALAWQRVPDETLRQRLHDYVSMDPSVNVSGTQLPKEVPPSPVAKFPLTRILAAAVAATPLSAPRGIRRQLFVKLAHHQGWIDNNLLAHVSQISADAVRRSAQRNAPELLRAGAMCLGDDRLLAGYAQLADQNPHDLWTNTRLIAPRDIVHHRIDRGSIG